MRLFLFLLMLSLTFFSCFDEQVRNVDVSSINVDFSIKRFDVDFYSSSAENLNIVKEKYPLLFPKGVADSVWVSKINDADEQELYSETQKVYKDVSELKIQLESLFKYVKYYNPKFKAPNVITMLTNIDYDNRVVFADSLMIVSLDVYLGKKHKFYGDYPNYIKENNTKSHIIVDIASKLIEKQVRLNTKRTFLSKIINEGKKMYLLDMYLPQISDKDKIGYTQEKLDWAFNNEEQIWKYFMGNKLIYSTDTKLNKRFIDNAPFSKFYLSEDNKSPGKIGVWLGWQIVASYMKYNDVSLQTLLKIDGQSLLDKSKYKPRK